MKRATEAFAVFGLFSALVLLSIALQGPFSMSGSAAVVVLGAAVILAFSRTALTYKREATAFFLGALLSALWYPVAYAAVGAAYAEPRVSSPRRLLSEFLVGIVEERVYFPMALFVGAVLMGGGFGQAVSRARRSALRSTPR